MFRQRYFLMAVLILSTSVLRANEGLPFEDLNKWVGSRLDPKDQLLCSIQSGLNWFFIARSRDRVKTGALIDVTSEAGDARTFVLSWEFRDGEGSHIGKPKPREVLISRHFEQSGRIFAEEVIYRYVSWATSFEADIGLEYYPTATKPDKIQVQSTPPPIVAHCAAQIE
jgi:hypothetical protein